VSQDAATYDSHGNALTTTKGGVTRTFHYDANGFFLLAESLLAPSGRTLTWQAGWDPVLGAMASMTDPDGNTTQILYDSLGRYAGRALNGGLPQEVVEYDWTPPFPKTTVWAFDGPLASVTAKPDAWSSGSQWRQSVQVANGRGELRYRGVRLSDT